MTRLLIATLICLLSPVLAFPQNQDSELTLQLDIIKTNISCTGLDDGSIQANVSGGMPPYSFTWSPSCFEDTTNTRENLSPGIYYLTVTDNNGLETNQHIILSEPSPIKGFTVYSNPSCDGAKDGSLTINITGGSPPYSYFVNNLPFPDSLVSGLSEGTHLVTVYDKNSCHMKQQVTLTDDPNECIRIPNAFTPNNDGTNDSWIIENLHMYDNYKISVYNRWGELVYYGEEGNDPWDGISPNNQPLPAGSYFYTIECEGISENKSGIVSIIL